MYVDDMTLEEAREWRADLERRVNRAHTTPAREQLIWDLQDLNDRIDELENE